METHKSKFNGVRALLKVRGYKVLNNSQIAMINELCAVDSLGVVDIANEIDGAPERRIAQSVVKARSFVSSGLNSLSTKIDPATA